MEKQYVAGEMSLTMAHIHYRAGVLDLGNAGIIHPNPSHVLFFFLSMLSLQTRPNVDEKRLR